MTSDESQAAVDSLDRAVRVKSLTLDVAAWVYGTVTLMSVLVVYDGWTSDIRFVGAVIVVVGPTLALALAHLFAKVLEFNIQESRPPTRAEWRHLVAHAAQFLMVAVPPLIILCCFSLLPNQTVRSSIPSMIYLGTVSLGVWGWVAGRRAGYRGLSLVLATLAGFFLGLVVIAFQLILKPH